MSGPNLGEPHDTYARLLLAADDAARAAFEAAVGGDYGRAMAAEIDLANARDAVTSYEMHLAGAWLMGFRLALKWHPADVVGLLDTIERMKAEWEEEAERYAERIG